ncbi:DUF6284 family protein [Dactylosporangium sp. NPDC049140]|uniref:DUF6284 family protein n=1 Tax=Dactylosporangium sp. NPDC049140 TaxID=3155647 RepID=UPI0033EAC93D
MNDPNGSPGPTQAQLEAIESEMPLIEAEIELLDVQIRIMSAHGPVDEVTAQRLRRSRDAVVAEALRWYMRQYNAPRRAA